MVDYKTFCDSIESLEYRSDRFKKARNWMRLELLKTRAAGTGITFIQLMQADFVAFLRAEIGKSSGSGRWFPFALAYIDEDFGPFEVFARASSKIYFERVKIVLGINSPDDLKPLFERYRIRPQLLPRWGFNTLNPALLLGLPELATSN